MKRVIIKNAFWKGEETLALVQTTSWKAAFREIFSQSELEKRTDMGGKIDV